MPSSSSRDGPLDDRSPYQIAVAVTRRISELALELPSEDAVWDAFGRQGGADQADYIEAIRRTQHSIFFYQMQHLYRFGIEKAPAQWRQDFCYSAGRLLLKNILAETIYPLLQVAIAEPGTFQVTVVAMIREYLNRLGGNRYKLEEEIMPDGIRLTVSDIAPERTRQYLQQYGLIPERCFQNSVDFITGGVHEFVSQVVENFNPPPVRAKIVGHCATVYLPIQQSDRFAFERLTRTLMQFVQQVQARQGAAGEEQQLESDLVLDSEVMRATWNCIRRASQTDELVLLLGESGTGKTFIAQKIHGLSGRKEGPFIPVCLTSDVGSENLILSNLFGHEKGAFTGAGEQKQGLFSLANGGTIFLDEIGDATPELQAKLLRVLENSTFKRLGGVKDIHVDVRIIVATNRDLEQLVVERKFREDLFYRLNVIPIRVPPLRERPESIGALIQFFLRRLNRSKRGETKQINAEVIELLSSYAWPGNVRELEHAVRHAHMMSDGRELTLSAFPEKIRASVLKAPKKGAVATGRASSDIIDIDALRRLIRATDARAVSSSATPHDVACHVEFAKRCYLISLIEELNGDLSLIGHYWDHGSEKTLRSLIQAYGLNDLLKSARDRGRSKLGNGPLDTPRVSI